MAIRDRIFALGHVEVLIQIHCLPNAEISTAIANDLNKAGVVLFSESEGKYKLTPRGEAWLDMILSTPLPEQRWVDPRSEEVKRG